MMKSNKEVLDDCRPDRRACAGQERAPEGMWFRERAEKSKPFYAEWRDSERVGRCRTFRTKDERAAFAKQWAKMRAAFGEAAGAVQASHVETWQTFARMTGDADPIEVARFWLRHHKAGTVNLSMGDAAKQFLELRAGLKIASDSASHMKLHVERFVTATGRATRLSSVDAEMIRAALRSLTDPDTGEPFSAATLRHHLRSWRCMLETARVEKWTDHNPADAVIPPQDESDERDEDGEGGDDPVNIMTLEQAQRFFAVNRDSLAIGRLALEAFGGVRFTFAARIKADSIKWADKGIVMPGKQHKSTNRHFVDGWPPSVFEWLKHAPAACWELPKRIYLNQKREAFERAGLKPSAPANGSGWSAEEVARMEAMRNVFRHSFASYHLAAFKDPKSTLYLMTKRSIASLNNDYRGRATKEDGEAYFRILP